MLESFDTGRQPVRVEKWAVHSSDVTQYTTPAAGSKMTDTQCFVLFNDLGAGILSAPPSPSPSFYRSLLISFPPSLSFFLK